MNSKIQLTETMSLPGVSQKSQDYGCASCPGKTFALLRKAGFEEVRRRGSLILVQKKLSPGIVTVPVPRIMAKFASVRYDQSSGIRHTTQ